MTAERKERLTSLAGVALLHLVLGWALLLSLAPSLVRSVSDPLDVFDVRDVPPPPPETPPEPQVKVEPEPAPAPDEPEGASAPAAPRDPGPAVVASKRIIDRDISPAAAAGLIPFEDGGGTFGSDGDADGGGSGGTGSGSGSGAAGSGSGGGGSGGVGRAVTRPELRSGRIVWRDYPRGAKGHQGIVEALLKVSASGAVSSCTVTRSSGNSVLDAATCRLMQQRLRFTPARDAQGNAVPGERGWQQKWWRD